MDSGIKQKDEIGIKQKVVYWEWAPLIRINKLWLWVSCSYLVNACSIYHRRRILKWDMNRTYTQLRLCRNCEFIMFYSTSCSRWSMLPSLYWKSSVLWTRRRDCMLYHYNNSVPSEKEEPQKRWYLVLQQ